MITSSFSFWTPVVLTRISAPNVSTAVKKVVSELSSRKDCVKVEPDQITLMQHDNMNKPVVKIYKDFQGVEIGKGIFGIKAKKQIIKAQQVPEAFEYYPNEPKLFGTVTSGRCGDLNLAFVNGEYGKGYDLRYTKIKVRGVKFTYSELMKLKAALTDDMGTHLDIDDVGDGYIDYGVSHRDPRVSALQLRHIVTVYDRSRYTKQLNVICWNNGKATYDIRKMVDGSPFKGGGVNITRAEAIRLVKIIEIIEQEAVA